ncbi:MAG TPA: ATP-binding protein [Myxococcaceae bacterium]|nr:ATP-binding protein [Myxococcaceae bacterium]
MRKREDEERVRLLLREQEARARAEAAERRASFLSEASRLLAGSLDSEQVLRELSELVVPAHADVFGVVLVQPDGSLRRAAYRGSGPDTSRLLGELAGTSLGSELSQTVSQALGNREALLFEDFTQWVAARVPPQDEYLARLRGLGIRSLVLAPLVAHGKTLGSLNLATIGPERGFAPADVKTVEELARRLAVALENARLYAEVQAARQEAEAERTRLRGLIEILPAFVSLKSGPEHVYQLTNPLYRKLSGREDLPGKRLGDVVPEGIWYRLAVEEAYREEKVVTRTEIPVKAFGGPDGQREERWLDMSFHPLRDERGAIEGTLSFGVDVTEKVQNRAKVERLAEELSNRRKWLEVALDLLPVPVLLIEPDTARILFSNAAAEEMAGGRVGRAKDVAGHGEAFHCTDEHGVRIPAEQLPGPRAARGERLRNVQLNWHLPDGVKTIIVHTELLPAVHGVPATVVMAFDDVTGMKDAERALARAVRVRDEFLTIASHELRTPVTALKMYLESGLRTVELGRGQVPPPVETKLRRGVEQLNRLVRLVDRLVEGSRLSAGQLDFTLEELDLSALVREVATPLVSRHVEAQVPAEPVLGRWPRASLAQLLTDLLENAVKYGENKPVEVRLEALPEGVRLSVRDQGIGISREDQRRIFNRFERAVSTQNFGGFGLGLWMCREVAQALGGSIRVESEPGRGSTFTVELPRVVLYRPPSEG